MPARTICSPACASRARKQTMSPGSARPIRGRAIWCEANGEHRHALDYDFSRDAANFDAIEASWTDLKAAPPARDDGDAPIFIIGMPRTGTTLVDRILSSHPEVESAGE